MDNSSRNLPPLKSLSDYAIHAEASLAKGIHAYFNGGAADETTLAANRKSWHDIPLLPHVLSEVAGGSASTSLLGQTLSHPIMVAPMALQRMAHQDGEAATAVAAEAQGTRMILSSEASLPMETVRAASRACDWFQIYWEGAREPTLQLAMRAKAAGFTAFVLTLDAPLNGVRNREQRAGFKLPEGIMPVNLIDIERPQLTAPGEGQSLVFDRLMTLAPTWDDLRWFCDAVGLPVIVKGVLRADDARRAVACGVAAIVVSNHGGRVLDTTPTTAEVLPDIYDAIGTQVPLIVDGGIRRGSDVFKAIALGATAVLVGRPIIWGLAVNGAHGVSHVLRILRDEFEITMALCGAKTVSDIGPDYLHLKL